MRPLFSVAMTLLLAGPAAVAAQPVAGRLPQAIAERQLDAARAIVVSARDDGGDAATNVALIPQIGGGVLVVAAGSGTEPETPRVHSRELLGDWSVEGLQPAAGGAKHGATAVLHGRHNVALLTHLERVRNGGEPTVRFAYPPEQTLSPGEIRDDPEHVPRILVAAAVDKAVWFLDSTGALVRWWAFAAGQTAAEPKLERAFATTRQAIVINVGNTPWFAWTARREIELLNLNSGVTQRLPGPLPTRVLAVGPTLLWPDRTAIRATGADEFEVGPLPELISPATAVLFTEPGSGGKLLIAGTPLGALYAWELPARTERWRKPAAEAGPWREMQLLNTGRRPPPLALAWQAAAGLVLDTRSGMERARFEPPQGTRYAAMLAVGARIVTATMPDEDGGGHGVEVFALRDAHTGLVLERDVHPLPAGGPVQRILPLDAEHLLLIRARAVTLLPLPGDR